MKAFGLLCLFFLIGTTGFVYFGDLHKGGIMSSNPGVVPISSNTMASIMKGRKLKYNIDPPSPDQDEESHVNLEDYRPIDPAPSSKASIRPGPVQHGTPLMPYIPKPSPPPGKPKRGG